MTTYLKIINLKVNDSNNSIQWNLMVFLPVQNSVLSAFATLATKWKYKH